MIIPTSSGLPKPRLGEWSDALSHVVDTGRFVDLATYLNWRASEGAEIYPEPHNIFAALKSVDPMEVRVVILGQDPYHGPGQAHGLAFSVQKGCDIPPSLRNMYAELQSDLGHEPPRHGYLQSWADQGVLLLNTLLTVEKSRPLAHKGKGWEIFTDAVISHVSDHSPPCVFMLWGNPARKKKTLIDTRRHLVIESVHPSPLSATRGFFGSRPFSQANEWLSRHGREPIDWKVE